MQHEDDSEDTGEDIVAKKSEEDNDDGIQTNRAKTTDSEDGGWIRIDFSGFRVCHSAELGLEIRNNGEELNAKLRALAVRHGFAPIVTPMIATANETDAQD